MARATDSEIVEFFQKNQGELNQERSDFLLPQIVDFVQQKQWVNTRPEYQRRQVWDNKKKSRLIESLLMNVPIPPIYLYEIDYSRYEVMDGQQRLNSIIEFFENRFKLSSLSGWPLLTGRSYADLPQLIQRGLNRRRLSATVIISDLKDKPYTAGDLRSQVFERLNTGGIHLNAQELRNCLYPGKFNKLLIELAAHPHFTDLFGIPPHQKHISAGGRVSNELAKNSLYKRMADCEYVLRFFAFRRVERLKGSIPRMLDKCMMENGNLPSESINELKDIFLTRLDFALHELGKEAFCLPDEPHRPSLPLYDALLIALDRLWQHRDTIRSNRTEVLDGIKTLLLKSDNYDVIIGKPGTARAIRKRMSLIEEALVSAAHLN